MITIIKNWLNRHFSDPQLLALVFLLLVGVLLILAFGRMLTPVFAAVVIAYLLDGMVLRLERLKLPRLPAVVFVFLVFLVGVIVLLVWLLPVLSRQIAQLVQVLPEIVTNLQHELAGLPTRYPDMFSDAQIAKVTDYLISGMSSIGQQILALSLASMRGLISLVVYLILVPLMVFFFLKDKMKILSWLKGFLPEERVLATEIWHEVNLQVANYIRGKMWEILIVWGATYAAFAFLGIRFALLLSFFAGVSVLVPYIGAAVMYVPVALIAYFQWGVSINVAYALIAHAVIQTVDGNLIAPLLISDVVNMHPVAVIVAVIVFGSLWGLWGLIFAVPLATLVHAVIKAWFKRLEEVRKIEEA
jgi:putative permease